MASRDLDELYSPLKKVIERALKIASDRNLPITITCTLRTPDEQQALYAQGRQDVIITNSLRAKVGLAPLTKDGNKRKVTWTKKSYHNTLPKSMAVDFAIGKREIFWEPKVDTNQNDIPDYKEFGEICKSLNPNIEWGGDWSKPDLPHIQWKNGKLIDQTIVKKEPNQPQPKPPVKKEIPPETIHLSVDDIDKGFSNYVKQAESAIITSSTNVVEKDKKRKPIRDFFKAVLHALRFPGRST